MMNVLANSLRLTQRLSQWSNPQHLAKSNHFLNGGMMASAADILSRGTRSLSQPIEIGAHNVSYLLMAGLNCSSVQATNYNATLCNLTLPAPASIPYVLPHSVWLTVLLSILALFVSVVTVLGNLLVIIAFVIERSVRIPSNYFIVSLAVTDFLIGLFSMPLYTLLLLAGYWPLGPVACDLFLSLDFSVCLTSQYTVFFITVDRFCSVHIPAKYRNWRTERKVRVMVAVTWVIPAIVFFTSIIGWQYFVPEGRTVPAGECWVQFMTDPAFLTILVICYYWVTLFVMSGLYVGIYKVALDLQRKADKKRKQTTKQLVSLAGKAMTDLGVGISRGNQNPGSGGNLNALGVPGGQGQQLVQQQHDHLGDSDDDHFDDDDYCGANSATASRRPSKRPSRQLTHGARVDHIAYGNGGCAKLQQPSHSSLLVEEHESRPLVQSHMHVTHNPEEVMSERAPTPSTSGGAAAQPLTREDSGSHRSTPTPGGETTNGNGSAGSRLRRSPTPAQDSISENDPSSQYYIGNSPSDYFLCSPPERLIGLKFIDSVSIASSLHSCDTVQFIADLQRKSQYTPAEHTSPVWKRRSFVRKEATIHEEITADVESEVYDVTPTQGVHWESRHGCDVIPRTGCEAIQHDRECLLARRSDIRQNRQNLHANPPHHYVNHVAQHTEEAGVSSLPNRARPSGTMFSFRLPRLSFWQTKTDTPSDSPVRTYKERLTGVMSQFRRRRGDATTDSKRERSKGERRAQKALRTITFILGAFIVCWTPYHVIVLIIGFCGLTCVNSYIYATSYWLCYLNSPINPFSYAYVNVNFKKAFVRILNCNWKRT